jgi:hypothetical protein
VEQRADGHVLPCRILRGATREDIRPDRAERRLRLITAIARGRRWLDEIIAGSIK